MIAFGLIVAHLVGDFLLQCDWMARNKSNPLPKGPRPCTPWMILEEGGGYCGITDGTPEDRDAWDKAWSLWKLGNLACFIHCVVYTLTIWAFSFWWMPWWGLLVVFGTHFPIDRWRLARVYMRHFGLEGFATGLFSSWSIIVVDQTMHLVVLWIIGAIVFLV